MYIQYQIYSRASKCVFCLSTAFIEPINIALSYIVHLFPPDKAFITLLMEFRCQDPPPPLFFAQAPRLECSESNNQKLCRESSSGPHGKAELAGWAAANSFNWCDDHLSALGLGTWGFLESVRWVKITWQPELSNQNSRKYGRRGLTPSCCAHVHHGMHISYTQKNNWNFKGS